MANKLKMDLALSVAQGSSTQAPSPAISPFTSPVPRIPLPCPPPPAAQIALFVIPVMVLLAWAVGQPLDLLFVRRPAARTPRAHSQIGASSAPDACGPRTPLQGVFETVITFLSAVIVSGIVMDGKTNWLEGMMLLAAYILIASAFWFYKDQVE